MGLYTSLLQSKPVKPEPSVSETKLTSSNDRTEKRSVSLPQKRRSKRYSFEFYDDQISRVRQLKYEAELEGRRLSLSDIVRQALDEFLQKQ